MMHTRKSIRLPLIAYSNENSVFSLTLSVKNRMPIFARDDVARAAMRVLREQQQQTGVAVYGFCFMPDHVHLVVTPSATCDVINFVSRFKNFTLRAAWQLGVSGTFWQRSFWDHEIRKDESALAAVSYVLNNPVRRGMVAVWSDYPYSGSSLINRRSM